MNELRKTQRKVYEAIKLFIKEKGYPPTVREIGCKVGLKSSSTVYRHLGNLKEKGYLNWEESQSRTMRILK